MFKSIYLSCLISFCSAYSMNTFQNSDHQTMWEKAKKDYLSNNNWIQVENMYNDTKNFNFENLNNFINSIPEIRRAHLNNENAIAYAIYGYICLTAMRMTSDSNYANIFYKQTRKLTNLSKTIAKSQRANYTHDKLNVDFLSTEMSSKELDETIDSWHEEISNMIKNIGFQNFTPLLYRYNVAKTLFWQLNSARKTFLKPQISQQDTSNFQSVQKAQIEPTPHKNKPEKKVKFNPIITIYSDKLNDMWLYN